MSGEKGPSIVRKVSAERKIASKGRIRYITEESQFQFRDSDSKAGLRFNGWVRNEQ